MAVDRHPELPLQNMELLAANARATERAEGVGRSQSLVMIWPSIAAELRIFLSGVHTAVRSCSCQLKEVGGNHERVSLICCRHRW